MPQARYSLKSTGPALLNPRVRTRESARVGGRHLDSPSTTVRLGHLAGIYNCLDSKSHRPFVLEFSLRPGSQCPPLRDLSSPSRTSPRPTGKIIPPLAEDGKRGLRLAPHFSGSRTRAGSFGFAYMINHFVHQFVFAPEVVQISWSFKAWNRLRNAPRCFTATTGIPDSMSV